MSDPTEIKDMALDVNSITALDESKDLEEGWL
jgi:hypothetical protein